MKKILFLTFVITSCVFGLQSPEKSKQDGRIQSTTFNSKNIYKVVSMNGYQTLLRFADDERIVDVACGFPDGWDLQERGYRLFVQPKVYTTKVKNGRSKQDVIIEPNKKDWKTNLIVTTNKREYVFMLYLTKNSNLATYKLDFRYPQVERQKAIELKNKLAQIKAQKLSKKEQKKKIERIKEKLNRTTVPRNWEFYMKIKKDSESIIPSYAYDDGVFTYIGFDSTKTFPSAFGADKNGKESMLNVHVTKDGKFDVLVIHKTLPIILLRSGDKLVGILNKGYAKNPTPKTRQTSNKDIVREVIE